MSGRDLISLKGANNIGGVYEDIDGGAVREMRKIENEIEQFNNGPHFASTVGSINRRDDDVGI